MSEIKKGDTVICINTGYLGGIPDATNPPLRKGSEYLVSGIDVCPCGVVALDVGIAATAGATNNCYCGRATQNEPIWWCDVKRFVKKQSLEEQKEEALKNEDYATLARLNKEEF